MEATPSSETFVLTLKHNNPANNNVTRDIKLENKTIYILSIPIS